MDDGHEVREGRDVERVQFGDRASRDQVVVPDTAAVKFPGAAI